MSKKPEYRIITRQRPEDAHFEINELAQDGYELIALSNGTNDDYPIYVMRLSLKPASNDYPLLEGSLESRVKVLEGAREALRERLANVEERLRSQGCYIANLQQRVVDMEAQIRQESDLRQEHLYRSASG